MVAVAMVPAGSASAGKPASLKAEYSFDSTVGGVVSDLTGLGHTLTLTGSWSAVDGVSSPAVAFAKPSMGSTPSVPDLNPIGREFAVTAVFRIPNDTSAVPDSPNIVQKGFFGDAGQWKMQLNPGPAVVQCRFKGKLTARLISSTVQGVDDGAWHTATCSRAGSVISVTVDGVVTQSTVNVGDIANGRPLQVGAKSMTSTSDQFPGIVDYVSVAMGDGAATRSREAAPR